VDGRKLTSLPLIGEVMIPWEDEAGGRNGQQEKTRQARARNHLNQLQLKYQY
jgi:hypothetical protein